MASDSAAPAASLLPPDAQSVQDREHLDLLAVFHFITAALAGLGLGFLGLHFLIFQAVAVHGGPGLAAPGRVQLPLVLFSLVYAALGFWLTALLVLNLLSGIFMKRRRARVFSLVVGAINCVHVPFGTVLGVFTLVVLTRASIRREYPAG